MKKIIIFICLLIFSNMAKSQDSTYIERISRYKTTIGDTNIVSLTIKPSIDTLGWITFKMLNKQLDCLYLDPFCMGRNCVVINTPDNEEIIHCLDGDWMPYCLKKNEEEIFKRTFSSFNYVIEGYNKIKDKTSRKAFGVYRISWRFYEPNYTTKELLLWQSNTIFYYIKDF